MPGAVVKKGAFVKYAIVGENAVIGDNSRIGDEPTYYSKDEWGIAVVGKDVAIENGTTIKPNQVV